MARPRSKLADSYGNLKVIADMGGAHALVECRCGRRKWVLRSNLRAGRISSCGQPGCRTYADRSLHRPTRPDAPTWLPQGAIPQVYAMATEQGVAHAAVESGVAPAFVQDLLDAAAAHGGLDGYMKYLNFEDVAPVPDVEKPESPVLGSAPVQPPKAWGDV